MKKILFITLSNIGDAILTTPVLTKLHDMYPNAKFDIVGDARSKLVFKYCPYVKRFIEKDKKLGLVGVISLLLEIRKEKYDLAVDLRSDGLLYFIRAKKKLYKKNNEKVHSVIKHYLALRKGIEEIPQPNIWISDKERLKIKKILGNSSKKILAIGLGANSMHKIWPAANYAFLANKISNNFDLIILVGDKDDSNLVNPFLKFFRGNVKNYCGILDILECAEIINKSTLYIGNDSGLGHIASAVNTKSFTIFGEGNSFRYHPWGSRSKWYQNKEKDINLIKPETILSEIKHCFFNGSVK